jgi:sodium transport system permease protein
MNWRNIGLIFRREVLDQLRDRRTLFMIAVLPILLYPALGIGMVQLTVLFSEQPRTVVILGAKDLPPPPLVEGRRFLDRWFRVPADAEKLLVLTDDAEPLADDPHAGSLEAARQLRELIDQREIISAQLNQAEKSGDLAAIATLRQKQAQSTDVLGSRFQVSGIQVLIVIPPDFARHLAEMKQAVVERGDRVAEFDYPRPLIVQNSADEKSLIAANRVQRVMDAWEREILKQALQEVGLPASLPAPINASAIDLAEEQQLSANVWSKLFPALLVIMALTGAFYPAIDLAAGEKERGTMETLLICPASRTEIVLGKFLTVMLFSSTTAILNLGSLGFTGKYMVSLAGGGPMAKAADLTLPPLLSLVWVLVMLVPLSALFSALCLAFATFARSSKEGQYYLTPLLMVTLGLTVFCLSPAVEIQPFYSVMPVMGPALLLKGLLLGNASGALLVHVIPVLATSFGYSLLALWWAIDQFASEDVLFREAERFDLRLWLRHLLRDKEPTPSFAEAGFCFVMIMMLQFVALKFFQAPLQAASDADRGRLMMQLLIVQQLAIVATPPLFMGLLLTSSFRTTFRLRWPGLIDLVAAGLLAFALHPLSLEFAARISWFFPPLPESISEVLSVISQGDLPWWIPFLAFAVAPAVCEEIAFRGFLLSGFLRGGREKLAIVLSALTFGIMHMIPQQVLNASLLGLVLGLIAVRSRSLWPGILFHLLYNGLELSRNRWGTEMPTAGPWGWLFRFAPDEGGLRYEPLLWTLAGLAACVLLTVLARPREPVTDGSRSNESLAAATGRTVLAPRP